jgi:integrase
MPTIKLTQAAVERLKAPESGRVEYWDSLLRGFGVRISAPQLGKPKDTARRTWQVMYRVKGSGKLVRETLGIVAMIPNVGEARERARESMLKARSGINPVAERRRAEEAAAEKLPDTFKAIAERYLERYAKKQTKPTTWRELERQLKVDVLPKWGERPIGSITRQHVAELLDGIVDRGSPVQANRQLARLRTLFKWALDEEIISADPTAKVRKVVKEAARDRTLSDDEIRLFWAACDKLGWPFGPLYRLLLLSAQRRDEVANVEWSEWSEPNLDAGVWILPRKRAKNDWTHEIHLSGLAIEIIEALPKIGADHRFVFTTTGRSPVSGFSRSKEALDRWMAELAGTPIEPWILHDLRRTAATGMARLGIAPHVVDKVLNHTSGTIRGVAAIYNRFDYVEERRAALESWGRYVENLVRPTSTNVLLLPITPRG